MDQISILHLSDLHINHVVVNNQMSWIGGWRAHDFLLCQALNSSLGDVRWLLNTQDAPLRVVVSGDLTAAGGASEFPIAHSLIRSLLRWRRLMPSGELGLRASDDQVGVVAGNHDQWGGQKLPPTALNLGLVPVHFRRTPWMKEWREGALVVELFGIDSNAGLTNTNWRARGRFSDSDLNALRVLIAESDKQVLNAKETRVRVIVTHHSPSYLAPLYSRPLHCTELDAASRENLLQLCRDFNISAVLTGHTHDFLFKSLSTDAEGPMELRSASTLQGPARRTPAPGFLVHRIRKQTDVTTWAAWRYGFDGSRFIRKGMSPCTEFAVG